MPLLHSRSDIHKHLNDFSQYLRKKGLKFTSQRALVARKIFGMSSHFTVDHLAEALKEKRDKISRATIYRIVSVMVEAGLLAEHDFGQNAKFYEHVSREEHHDHIICMDCGHIKEFCDEKIENIQISVANNLGFTLADHSLNLYGACLQLKTQGTCIHKQKKSGHLPPRS